jgi:hypothetical protein
MNGLKPNQKGAIAETAIAHEAIKLGIDVYRPYSEGGRCDLIFDTGRRLLRVQCKWATRIDAVVSVRLNSSCRAAGGGYVRRSYGPDEIVAIAAYCAVIDKCYYLPISMVARRNGISLRLEPTKNRQSLGIHFAEHYELGAIAQLGERVAGSHEAAGSSPASST